MTVSEESGSINLESVGLLYIAGEPPPPWGVIQTLLDCGVAVTVVRALSYDHAGIIALNLVQSPSCLGVIALTPSGNGVQMYVNQHSDVAATGVTRTDITREVVLMLDVKVLEIPLHVPDVPLEAIAREFVHARRGPLLQ